MFKKKNILSMILALTIVLSSTMVFAEEVIPEISPDMNPEIMDTGLAIPKRDASKWALGELVDSDRYGLYKVEDLYKNNLKSPLNPDFKEMLLDNFSEKLENSNLEKVERPEFLAEIKDSGSRGDFLRELYNRLLPYVQEESLAKEPILYLKDIGVLRGNGREYFLDRRLSLEEGILFAKRSVDHIISENDLDTEGLMWKVENKGNTVYLLGSIHYGIPELYPLREEIMENFSNSEKLFVEVDITDQEKLLKAMMDMFSGMEEDLEKSLKYEDGTTLDMVVDKETYSEIVKIMEKYNIAEEEYVNLKIQGIDQKLNEIIMEELLDDFLEEAEELEGEIEDFELEFEEEMEDLLDSEFMKLIVEGPELGIDFYFIDKAKTLNKKVGELESIESQMELLFGELSGLFGDDLSEEEQLVNLKEALGSFDKEGNVIEELEAEENFEDMETEIDEDLEEEMNKMLEEQLNAIKGMFDAIKLGDAEKLAEIFIETDGAEAFGGELLGERDEKMAKKIADLLEGEEEKTYFIVVGAAHFVVDGTIIDNLEDMGYEVERLN